jgi:hypothetical protein
VATALSLDGIQQKRQRRSTKPTNNNNNNNNTPQVGDVFSNNKAYEVSITKKDT